MPRVTFLDGRKFDLVSPDKLTNVEVIAIEKVTGLGLKAFMGGIVEDDMSAVTGWAWVSAKRTEPSIRYSEVEFSITDGWENTEEELAEAEAAAAARQGPPDPTEAATEPAEGDPGPS